MILQSTTKPLCMLYSLAMLLDVPADELALELPDGMEQTWQSYKRGHHINELVACALRHKVALVKFDFYPRLAPSSQHEPITVASCLDMHGRPGLIYGLTESGMHMVAWDGLQIFNPTDKQIVEALHFYAAYKIC